MIFINNKNYVKSSKQLKAQHKQRCAKLFATLAFFTLFLIGVMLYLAISSQYSEQKTAYYVIFAVSVVGFFVLIGLSVYQFLTVKRDPPPSMQHRLSFIQLDPKQQIRIDDQYFRSQLGLNNN